MAMATFSSNDILQAFDYNTGAGDSLVKTPWNRFGKVGSVSEGNI